MNIEEAYYQLLKDMSYEESSLDKLDAFFNAYANQENRKELQFKRDSWKALILQKMGRYEESLQYYLAIYDLKENGGVLFFNTTYGLAYVYHKLGRKNEAAQTITNFLSKEYPNWHFDKLNMLNLYVDILDGEEVPEQNAQMVEEIKVFIGVETHKHGGLNSQIREIFQKNKSSNIRYSQLRIDINDSNLRKEEKMEKLKVYIEQEAVLFYRKMAEASLSNRG